MLPYITLCYIASRFFLALKLSRVRLYYAAASQPRVFARLLVGNSFAPQRSNKQSWFASNKYDLGLKIHCDWEQVVVTILYNLRDGDLMSNRVYGIFH